MSTVVSVIIPVYNRQEYIEECIASLQNQSYEDLEIILIDDGSTDQTLELCRTLAQEELRIKLIEANHCGVSAARNIGLDTAQGKYVFFLDSDDVIHPQLLQTLVQSMETTGAEMAGTIPMNISTTYWHYVPQIISKHSGPAETTYWDHKKTLNAVFTSETPLSVVGGVMIRRDWIDKTRFRTDLYIGEDFFFVYENLIKGSSSVFLSQKWYYCRLHASNSSWDFKLSGFLNRFYRRQLVWESEERFGREHYANQQKKDAFVFYIDFLQRKTITTADRKQMRKLMKEHKKSLWPALPFSYKVLYIFSVYMPVTYPVLLPLIKWTRKFKNK